MITLSSELVIVKNLTITGPGVAALTISGNNATPVFFINPGAPGATSGPSATPRQGRGENLTIGTIALDFQAAPALVPMAAPAAVVAQVDKISRVLPQAAMAWISCWVQLVTTCWTAARATMSATAAAATMTNCWRAKATMSCLTAMA